MIRVIEKPSGRWRHFVGVGVLLTVLYIFYFVGLNSKYNTAELVAPLLNINQGSAFFEAAVTVDTSTTKAPEKEDAFELEYVSNGSSLEPMHTLPDNSTTPSPSTEFPLVEKTSAGQTDEQRATTLRPPVIEIPQAAPGTQSTFSKVLNEFNWSEYEEAIRGKNATLINTTLEKFILQLSYFLALEPLVPVNSTCKLPPLDPSEAVDCSKYPTGFTGEKTMTPKKIGVLIQFGFDVDVLEIYLNEMYDLVDQFFVIESTKSHQRTFLKPLMWEKVQFQPRFVKFVDKITHFILDDAQSADVSEKIGKNPGSQKTIWLMESLQETLRWEKFLEWNKAKNLFTEDDVLGFGDADEIPSRKMVNMLKYCKIKGGQVDFGIWFPFGNIKYAFATDWPVRGHRYTLGDPGFWTLKRGLEKYNSKDKDRIPSRTHGTGSNYLLGGMHMTHYGYLPFQLVKHITATEGGPLGLGQTRRMSGNITVDQVKVLEMEMAAVPKQNMLRVVNLTQISKEMQDIAIFPWFYDCNRNRYPVWEGNRDTRLYLPVEN